HNNYRIYHDLDHGKMVFMPHGMDQMFWKPEGPLVPAMKGLVAKTAMQIPEVRQRYLDRATELLMTTLRPESLTNRVMELARRVRPALESLSNREEAENYQSELNTLLARIGGRMRSLASQATGVKELLRFEGKPIALASWDLRN